jgi:hypothetical protein
MCVKLQMVICGDDGREEIVTDLVTLKKDSTRIEHLGLSLKEAKQLPPHHPASRAAATGGCISCVALDLHRLRYLPQGQRLSAEPAKFEAE